VAKQSKDGTLALGKDRETASAKGKAAKAKPKKKAKAKAATDSTASSSTKAPVVEVKEFVQGLDGSIRKSTVADDIVNAVTVSIDGVDSDKVDFPFVCNMLLLMIIHTLLGEISIPKNEEDTNVFLRAASTHSSCMPKNYRFASPQLQSQIN
jgi:hypothetical protein